MNSEKIILGVDPGTNILGYGILKVNGSELSILSLGVVKLDHLSDHALKLQSIFDRLKGIIQEYNPDEFAIEAPFYGKNIQSMLKLGRAQGVAIAAALSFQIPVNEYSPKKIKQAVTGSGNASKEQLAHMLSKTLNFNEIPKYLDATDALAAAVCHHYQTKSNFNFGSKSKGWGDFLKNNPDKIL